MTSETPVLSLVHVCKAHGAPAPLRIERLEFRPTDRVVLRGLDTAAAEMLVHLITGAVLPDEGTVLVAGQDTRTIGSDIEWLSSLDRFGLVTNRAVLIDKLSVASNLALPLTLAIDPMVAETRCAVEKLADEVGLPRPRLDAAVSELTPLERVRVHAARALALDPQLLILEQPTVTLGDEAARMAVGEMVARVGMSRAVGWLAISNDWSFATAAGGRTMMLDSAGRAIADGGMWHRLRSVLGRSPKR